MPTISDRQRVEALEAERAELLVEAERVISAAEESGSRQTAEEHAALVRAFARSRRSTASAKASAAQDPQEARRSYR